MGNDSFFVNCAEVLSLCQSLKDDLSAVLDPQTGFASRLRDLCTEQLEEIQSNIGDGMGTARASQATIESLRLERNTWSLLQHLMAHRKMQQQHTPTARMLLAQNPYTPTSNLADAIQANSPLLQELIIVKEWLHEIAPEAQHPEFTTGYWRFTKNAVMHSHRSGQTGRDTGLVKEMDPDVVGRYEGKGLASDDAGHEKNLMFALYAYIRAGKFHEAAELCRKSHQPWRAASIRGAYLFRWHALSSGADDDDSDDSMDEEQPDLWEGNRRRRLWKSMCTRAALNPSLSDPERTLYAALAPSPQTYGILKGACRTWEDHLWAHLNVVCEEKEMGELLALKSESWWENNGVLSKEGAKELTEQEREREEDEWQAEVIRVLEGLGDIKVEDGAAAEHALHFSQLQIILNRTSPLLEAFANKLKDGSFSPATFDFVNMSRFFAHLCLFLGLIDIPTPPLATQVILESYLQVLESSGQRSLIAIYASALGENAVERYALFLVSLELSASIEERKEALWRAKEHGLDIDRIAVVTAERSIEKVFKELPSLRGAPLPTLIGGGLQGPPLTAEELLLRSIEWTTFKDTTYDTALEQANVTLRYLLGAGRLSLAQNFLGLLPSALSSISEPEEQATEYLHYRQFFMIWDLLTQVLDVGLQEPRTREEKESWDATYRDIIDQAYEMGTKILTSEWLVSDVELPGGDGRRRELIRIRQIYIPELVLRIHFMLVNSRRQMPGNLKRALHLVNVVADSRYKLYEDFIGLSASAAGTNSYNQRGPGSNRLTDYLESVRKAVLHGVEDGGSADPFRALTK